MAVDAHEAQTGLNAWDSEALRDVLAVIPSVELFLERGWRLHQNE
jgi:hypothetical protein